MPQAAPKPCNHPGCGALTHGRYCAAHEIAKRKAYDQARGSAAKRGYGYKWQKAAKAFLRDNPLCVDCTAEGRTGAATEVDHEIPHKGDQRLFWDKTNWRARCKPHHSRKTAREDGRWGGGGSIPTPLAT